MDSKLDSIFRTTFRPAEKTDTWLGIGRHEPDQDRRKKSDDGKPEKDEAFDDNAAISVPALHAFLRTLLQQSGAPAAGVQGAAMHGPETPHHAPPANTQAAHAAMAYQNTTRHTPGARIDLSGQPVTDSGAPPPSLHLSQDEIRRIHQLLDDVQTLANRGVDIITIEKADTFLESLALGVRAAISRQG